MLRKFVQTVLVAVALFGCARYSEATPILDGKTLEITYRHPTINDVIGTNIVVVGAGIEWQAFSGLVNVDVSDTNIRFTFLTTGAFQNVSFSGFAFFDTLGTIPSFTGVTLNSTNMSGFTQSRLSFDADHIFVNWQGLPFTADTFVSVDVAAGSAAVPEPATWTLVSCGLVLLGRRMFFTWRRRPQTPDSLTREIRLP